HSLRNIQQKNLGKALNLPLYLGTRSKARILSRSPIYRQQRKHFVSCMKRVCRSRLSISFYSKIFKNSTSPIPVRWRHKIKPNSSLNVTKAKRKTEPVSIKYAKYIICRLGKKANRNQNWILTSFWKKVYVS